MVTLLQQVAAQDRSISGRVTDATSGQGLPGVTVLVKGTTVGASTDANMAELKSFLRPGAKPDLPPRAP